MPFNKNGQKKLYSKIYIYRVKFTLAKISGILFCSILLIAFTKINTIYKITEGKITFSSEASFETITATSEKLTGALDTSNQKFAFFVSNSSFEGFNSLLQSEHFKESYIESEKNPRSVFTGKIIEKVPFQIPGIYSVRAKGLLNIHGVEQERIIKCELTIENETIKVVSNFSVYLVDHGIAIPRIVFDKISPEIKISVVATLKQKTE